MIFNDDLIFIHIGKTAGMSCSEYLLNNLQPILYNCHADALKESVPYNRAEVVPLTGISRHCTLEEAIQFIQQIKGKTLADFAKVIAVIRHPYALEYSYYQHLRKPHVQERRKDNVGLIALANGDFRNFVEFGGFHREGVSQDGFVKIEGKIPANVELVKFEELTTALPQAIRAFRKSPQEHPMPHRNKSQYAVDLNELLTAEIEELIYRKHQFLFDSGYYQRQTG